MKKTFIALILVLAIACLPIVHVNAAMAVIDMIWANPSENCENEMNISFQSSYQSATVEYTKASDKTFSNKMTVRSSGVNGTKAYDGNKNYFHHSVTLTELDGNTSYIYRVKAGNTTSSVNTFKTSGVSGTFNFALIGDIHSDPSEAAKMKSVDKLVTKTEELTNSIGGIDFLLCYGDMVKYGESYTCWQQWNNCSAVDNYMIAAIPGNKEYYSTSKARTTNLWFTNEFNNPKNGVKDLESTYYFIYNSVLFIALDSICDEGSLMKGDAITLKAQQDWFEEVMKANEGKYQYSIVFRHYPYFTTDEADTDGAYLSWGKYPDWYPLFDKYDIDLVITGDNHAYARSQKLYNNTVSTDDTKGTVYITAPQIYSSFYNTIISEATNHLMVNHQSGSTTGSMYATVNNDELTLNLLAANGSGVLSVYDSVTIKAKRNLPIGSNKTVLEKSLSFTANADKTSGVIDFDNSVLTYASNIKVKYDNQVIGEASPLYTNKSYVEVTGLESDAINNVEVEITYTNGDVSTVNIGLNTHDYYGEIYGFKVDAKAKLLSWNCDLQNDVVNTIKIYKNDNLLATLTKDITSYQLDSFALSDTYKLEALASNGDVLYTNTCAYNIKYDVNMDGVVDSKDIAKLAELIMSKYDFSSSEVNLFDANGDNNVDVCDISQIKAILEEKLALEDEYYKVIFVDMDGSVISTEYVKYGSDATLPSTPTHAGYSFVNWSKSNKYVTAPLVIRAVYTK